MVIFNLDRDKKKKIAAAATNKRSYSASNEIEYDDEDSDGYLLDWYDVLLEVAKNDDVDNLLKLYDPETDAEVGLEPWPHHPYSIRPLIDAGYVKCLKALMKYVNVTLFDEETGMTALHYAASCLNPDVIKVFLEHGAPTDLRCSVENDPFYGMLPLSYALYNLHYYLVYFSILIPEQSIFKMLITLCLPQMRPKLDAIRLLVDTDNLGEEIHYYAKEGRLFELAILLMVAREKVTSVPLFKGLSLSRSESDSSSLGHSMTLRDFAIAEHAQQVAQQVKQVNGNGSRKPAKKCNQRMMSVLLLLEVFDKVGNEIEKYLQQEVPPEHSDPEYVAQEVSNLFTREGFELKCIDIDLSFLKSFDWPMPWSYEVKFHVENEYQINQLGNSLATISYKNWRMDPILPRCKTLKHEKTKVKANDPLHVYLKSLRGLSDLKRWTATGKSIYELLSILSSTELRNHVDIIKVHTTESERILELACYYACKGDLVELAALLMVAWQKLKPSKRFQSESGSTSIRQCIMSEMESLIGREVKSLCRANVSRRFETKKVKMLSALQLLDLFEKAGDAFDSYLQSQRNNEIAKDAPGFLAKINLKKKSDVLDKRIQIIDPQQVPSEDLITDSGELLSCFLQYQRPDFRKRRFNTHLVSFWKPELLDVRKAYRTACYHKSVDGSRSFHTLLSSASPSTTRLGKLAPFALSLTRLLKRL